MFLKDTKKLNLFGVKRNQKYGSMEHSKKLYNGTLNMINLKDINIKYIGRQASSATATGNANKHLAQQKEILEKILKIKCQKNYSSNIGW